MMPVDPSFPSDPTPKSRAQIIADFFRERERLGRQIADTIDEGDHVKPTLLVPELTAEDIANAVPARPLIEDLLRRLK